ncbi:CU044_2847 family protein [Kitasatospora sp. NPDC051853]|uniref:CU044_2847 family protein n=1 Tax=Kitasatospora sp. NPDC051853 TaxID=3364058 RepID=UPI00379DB5DF
MSYFVELPLDSVDETAEAVRAMIEKAGEGLVEVARPGQVVARVPRSPGEMLVGVRPAPQDFVDGFRGRAHAPDEAALESGLSLPTQADVVISSTATEAKFKVSLTWNRVPVPSAGPTS